MKKHSIPIIVLVVIAIIIPVVIYIFTKTIDISNLKSLYDNTVERLGFSEKTIVHSSVSDEEHAFSIGSTGDYTWGSFEDLYSNWALPYTVTEEQYRNNPSLVGYCSYLGWPTIKSLIPGYMSDIDEQGSDHAYSSWVSKLRLANRDGHRQRIECSIEANFNNLSKAIAYAKSGLNGNYTNGDIQNLIWNSYIWVPYGADAVVEGNLNSATQIDTIGGVSYHYQGDANTTRLVRAQQFATWAYQVLGDDHTLDIKITPEKASEDEKDGDKKIHVEADQANLSYLVGPFKLDLTKTDGGSIINDEITAAGTGRQTLGDFVYKEMTLQNYGETAKNAFIKTRFIIHAEYTDGTKEDREVKRNNGTIALQEESAKTVERIVITDENGAALKYGLPEFGKEFYVKYYLTTDLAKDHTLKYLQPEIKAQYIDDGMMAAGIKAHSIKVSYSIHYSLCNWQNPAVMNYVLSAGYNNFDLGDTASRDLVQAFFYSSDRGKRANVQDGIDALKQMVADSNQGGSATVTWIDDKTGWDHLEDKYGSSKSDMCDGVFLDECDFAFLYNKVETMVYHNNYFFACEYDTVNEFEEALLKNHSGYLDVAIDPQHSVRDNVGNSMLFGEESREINFDFSKIKADVFTSTRCGCTDLDCDCCYDCYDNDDDEDYCDCEDDEDDECECGCKCKFRYERVEVTLPSMNYIRPDIPGTDGFQLIKSMYAGDGEGKVVIDASDYKFSSQAGAKAALVTQVKKAIKTLLDENEDKFKKWFEKHAYPALYVPWGTEDEPYSMPFVEESQTQMQKVTYNVHKTNDSEWKDKDYKLTKKEINEYLGGNVSENKQGIASKENYQVENVWQGSGIEVTLIDLGIKGAMSEPQPPTPPEYTPHTPIHPISPQAPIYVPEPINKPEYTLVEDSQTQIGAQCAMFAICNALRSAGFTDLRAEDVVRWMYDHGYYTYYGGTMMNPTIEGKFPSRENCREFAQWYISTHTPAGGTSNIQVNLFTNDQNSSLPMYIDAAYITAHLPQEVNGNIAWEPGKTYSTVQACYFGNNEELNYSASHYVAFNKYRYNAAGELEVYVLNSCTGNHSSKWVKWSSIAMINYSAGHGQASDGYLTSNPDDWGHLEITYQVSNVPSGSSIPGMNYDELHARWVAGRDEYFATYNNYINALHVYNDAITNFNEHKTPISQATINAYNSALNANTAARTNWQATDTGAAAGNITDANYTSAQARYANETITYNTQVNIYNEVVQSQNDAQAEYEAAYNQYLVDYAAYEAAHAAWAAQIAANKPEPKIRYINVTDKNGNYGFQRLNPMHTYKLQFRYDGLEFIAELDNPTATNGITDISDNIKNRITAYELSKNDGNVNDKAKGREEVNDFFKDIDASNTNYKGQKGENKAYGWYTKLRADDASFITYADFKLEDKAPTGGTADDNNIGAFRFVDAYDRFKQKAIEDRATKELKDIDSSSIQKVVETYDDIEKDSKKITYEHVIDDLLKPDLISKGVGQNVSENNNEHNDQIGDPYNEVKQVCNFIYDSLVTAETQHSYPDDSAVKFFLEDVGTSSNSNSDGNNRNVNNTDNHSNYNHLVVDDPFPVGRGRNSRRINSLYNKINTGDGLTIKNRDQARNVDFTFKRRDHADLVIGMDIEAVTLLINGQKEVYKYGDLELDENSVEELARISFRAKTNNNKSNLLNYNKSYSRVITESMYLYDGNFIDEENGQIRDLSMFITYKIVIKNTGDVDMNVGYIVDHYDSYYMQWKKEDQDRIKAIVDNPDYFTANVTENDDGNHDAGRHYYDSDKKSLAAGNIDNMYNEVFIEVGTLESKKSKTMTITFEQQKDKYGRIKVNQDLETGWLLVGDKNVVEIDGYSTASNDIFKKGLITRLSNIGNLCPKDFYDTTSADPNKAGGLIDDYATPTVNRVEVDTASAPNLVIYIPSKGYVPCISGYVFEDVRSEKSEKALIGNGKYNKDSDNDIKDGSDTDKKIQGVTVQLVELVRQLDANGLRPSGNDTYVKEKIWSTTEYDLDSLGVDARRATDKEAKVPDNTVNSPDVKRYYSGTDKAKIILDVSDGYLSVKNKRDENGDLYTSLKNNDGMYKFVNVPPGLFVVRFIYGDTTQTVLVKNREGEFANEVNKLIPNTNISTIDPESVINYEDAKNEQYMFLKGTSDGFVSTEGLNSKSYNGNDYKSTVYQNDATLNVDGSYEGINVYKDYNKQNFTNEDGISMTQIEDGDLLNKLYYYDITKADNAEKPDHKNSVSDAKDIYAFRQNSDNYAKGYISSLETSLKAEQQKAQNEIFNDDGSGTNPITLRNYRNEIMNSFYQLGTYTGSDKKPSSVDENKTILESSNQQADRQVRMLQELMKYTRMVAQTGVIDFEIEYTVENWANTNGSDGANGYIEVTELNSDTPDNLNLPREGYTNTDTRIKHYHIRDLNLGLVERPEAQIRINKNVTNIKIQLSSGETLFDTNKSVNNLYYAFHKEHTYKFKDYRLQWVKVTTNSLTTPELIQAYMDDELIENATLEVTYSFTMENLGEVDYLDKKFYYTGKEDNPTDLTNVSRTNIDEVLDYVANKINFNESMTNSLDELRVVNKPKTTLKAGYEKANWQVKSVIPEGGAAGAIVDSKTYYEGYIYPFGVTEDDAKREQTPIGGSAPATLSNAYLWGSANATNQNADLVNREYFDRVFSYSQGSIVTTDRLSTKKYNNDNYYSKQLSKGESDYAKTYGLLPKAFNNSTTENYKIETPLVLSVTMSPNDDLVFPNLVEAVRVSNSVGRRCSYSTVGNQPMANQSYGNDISSEEKKDTLLDKYSTYNPVDVVTPIEIDADSSQSVRILPPTGFNKNNSNLYFALIGGFSILIVSIAIIKIGLGQNKEKKKSHIKRWK